jgi:hypothetical protein
MRQMIAKVCALAVLTALAGAAPAAAQDIRSHSFSASPTFFNPGDPINLSVYAEWDTNSDCQFYYGHWCDPYEARFEIWGSNGFYDTFWVGSPGNGWGSWQTTDWNPGSSSVTYHSQVTVRYNTPSGPWTDWSDRYATVNPAGQPTAWFYEHINYTGSGFYSQQDVSYVGNSWNDRISSVRVPAGKTVQLYEHSNFGGQSLILTSDAPDLRNFWGPGKNGTWNDCVSSFRIY